MLVAIAALLVALGGTAVAASRYIITSTSQISPSVLQQLTARAHAAEVKLAASGAHAVVTRVHLTAPYAVTSPTELQEVTGLAGATWTQRAGETQGVVEGTVRLKNPGVHDCSVAIRVSLDGYPVAFVGPGMPAGTTTTVPFHWINAERIGSAAPTVAALYWLPEAEVSRTHQIQVAAEGSPGQFCNPNPEPVLLEQVHVAVIGLK